MSLKYFLEMKNLFGDFSESILDYFLDKFRK